MATNYMIRKIDPDLWREVKGYASFHGVTIADLVQALLKGWVDAQRTQGIPQVPSHPGPAKPWLEREENQPTR